MRRRDSPEAAVALQRLIRQQRALRWQMPAWYKPGSGIEEPTWPRKKISEEKISEENISEESNRQACMDIIGCARTKIAREEKSRRCPHRESVEAHRWRHRRQGASAGGVAGYKGMNDFLPTK
jgi:hypothetical protein